MYEQVFQDMFMGRNASPYNVLRSEFLTDESFMDLVFIGPALWTIVYKKKSEPNEFEAVIQVEGDFFD